MIRRVLLLAAVLFVLGAKTNLRAHDLELGFDPDLTAYLVNTSAALVSFDGYQISSEGKNLDPTGWDSISDRVPARISDLIAGWEPAP